ncbi:ABC transporter substrate-binding protein [Microbacterium sp. MYb64]|uniref:ABC transporter substrate-binding protein n=1 Tax=Microbacterium sp. MYb64 TaxID=1848691 RepID=UPI0015E3E6E2|nr:ABC transporter substrate-binding protein [Microbacterium sp. MYb64]
MKRTKTAALVAAAGAIALLLSACSGTGSASSSGGAKTAPLLSIGSFVEPPSWDPAVAQEGNYIPFYQAVYDTLIRLSPDGKLEPMLATKWSYNADNTELTLTLRDDVTFTDGSKFDGEAAVKNIEHFRAANGPQATLANYISKVSAPDAKTLVISLSAPDPSLLRSLTNALGFMASPKVAGTPGIAKAPVGSGPYVLDPASTIVGSQYAFTRTKNYWGAKLPYDQIQLKVLTDETARMNALRSGQVDAAPFVNKTSYDELKGAGLTALSQESDWTGFQFYDRGGVLNPAFADVRVRQALVTAIDKKGIFKSVLLERGKLTNQIFNPNDLAYDPSLEDGRWDYDPAKAKQLLAQAGYGTGLEIELPLIGAFPPAVYTTIIQNLQDVGVTVKQHQFAPGEAIPGLTGAKFSFAYMQLNLFDDWAMMNQTVVPTAPWNPFKISDPTADGYVTDYQNATSDDERQTAGRALNKHIVDNVWFGVFYLEDQVYGVDKKTTVTLQKGQAVPSIFNYSPAN